jgi:hypothetical protein
MHLVAFPHSFTPIQHTHTYCDMKIHYQATAVLTGDSTTAVAREHLCGHDRKRDNVKEVFFAVYVRTI